MREARMANGLVRGHAYTITKVAYANVRGQEVMLVRIRYSKRLDNIIFFKLKT
jgi:hypothetical protein